MEMSDVFLSHNSQDKPLVRVLAKALAGRGFAVWFHEQDLPAGIPWIPRLESAIDDTAAVFVVIGSAGIGPWQQPEIEAALLSAVDRKTPIVPVLLASSASGKLEVPTFLRRFTWVNFSNGIDDAGLDRLGQTVEIGRALRDKAGTKKKLTVGDTTHLPPVKGHQMADEFRSWQNTSFIPAIAIPLSLSGFSPSLFADSWIGNALIGLLISLLLVVMSGFFASAIIRRNTRSVHGLIKPAIGILLVSISCYFGIYFAFTETRTGSPLRTLCGFYSDEFRNVLAVNLGNYQQTNDDFEFDPERIYKPWSLTTVKVFLSMSFALSSIAAGASSLFLKTIYSSDIAKSKQNHDSLVAIDLPEAIRKKLYSFGVETVSDLVSMAPRQLLHERRIDEHSLQEIEKSLSRYGLSLRADH